MSSPWTDRLVEVWATPGLSGAGVLIGRSSVLTARHVVSRIASGAEEGRLLARVVRPNGPVGEWVRMLVTWSDPDWDLALLSVDTGDPKAEEWLVPQSCDAIVVALSAHAELGCEAVGFPQAAVHERSIGTTTQKVRQTEQVVGTLLPSGQGKIRVPGERFRPHRWMPFDIATEPVSEESDWGGMSGAGVILRDGRLAATVVAAATDRQSGRLYVVPLGEALRQCEGLASAWSSAIGGPPVVEVLDAPRWRAVLMNGCLSRQGTPLALCDLKDLNAFGVKHADVPGEPPFLNYLPRADDKALRDAMNESSISRRTLLVVGGSAAGKSRSAAEAVLAGFPNLKLLRPKYGLLPALLDMPSDDATASLVWLDDIERYMCPEFGEVLQKLLSAGRLVIATVRREELDRVTTIGGVHRPAIEALTDQRLVSRFNWAMDWTPEERAQVETRISNDALRAAVASGTPLGAWCVAGPQLILRLQDAKGDDERPARYALVRTVLDWMRTSIGRAPLKECVIDLMNRAYLDAPASDDELRDAMHWASEDSVLRAGRRVRHTLLTISAQSNRIELNDYLRDHRPGPDELIHHEVWRAAIEESIRAPGSYSGPLEIGSFAMIAGEYDLARDAWMTLVPSGRADAMNALGVLESALQNRRKAQEWFERAACVGNLQAIYTLGKSAFDRGDLDIARQWWGKGSAAGDTASMVGMSALEGEIDAEAAEQWLLKAAAAGDGRAMWNLGLRASSDEEKVKWWNQAAEAGHPEGMFYRGFVCDDEGNHDEALKWWKEAAAAGSSDALNHLGTLCKDERPDEARQLFEQAANDGNGMAMINLGTLLFETDRAESARWLLQALATDENPAAVEMLKSNRDYFFGEDAESGDSGAMNRMAFTYLPEDPANARLWLERAASAGSIEAMGNLAGMLSESEPETSCKFLEQAADGGDENAMTKLADILAATDAARAEYWRSQAEFAHNQGAGHSLMTISRDPNEASMSVVEIRTNDTNR